MDEGKAFLLWVISSTENGCIAVKKYVYFIYINTNTNFNSEELWQINRRELYMFGLTGKSQFNDLYQYSVRILPNIEQHNIPSNRAVTVVLSMDSSAPIIRNETFLFIKPSPLLDQSSSGAIDFYSTMASRHGIRVPHHWPFVRKSADDQWIPSSPKVQLCEPLLLFVVLVWKSCRIVRPLACDLLCHHANMASLK